MRTIRLEDILNLIGNSMIHLESAMSFMVGSFGNTLYTQVMNMMNGAVDKTKTMKQSIERYSQMKLLLKLTLTLKDRTAYLLDVSLKELGLMGLVTLNGIVVTRVNTYNYFFLNLGEYTLLIRGKNSRSYSFAGCQDAGGIILLVHTAMARGEVITL